MKTKHFELIEESKVNDEGITLFRIKLTIDCKWGRKGTLGGWIESEKNIYGDAWVSGNAQVYGDALISGDAKYEKNPLQIQGSRHFFNENGVGIIQIGCKRYSFSEWLEKFEEIGMYQRYTEMEIKEYKMYIDLAIGLSKLRENK